MWGDTFWLRNVRWFAVWLVVVGHCLGQKQQQRLSFSHLDDIASNLGIKKCAPGYYRDNKGLYLGRCVPCVCNGHSNTCEDGSGKCLNCLRNTAGDNCERCREGYYGNATQGTCQVCPCPLATPYNSFATSCREVGGRFECLCKPGYTGSKCQWCAPGYYGEPLALNGKCSPCNCGNNGNPGNCVSQTGVCRNMEPKDTSTDEMCDECDSCVQTLTDDLERMDRDLADLKSQLQNVNASAFAQERMKKLEKNIEETKNLLNRYRSNVMSQRLKVNELESGTIDLTQDITILGKKADNNFKNTQTVFNNVEHTNQRAQDLVSEVQDVWKRIQELLAQLKDINAGGSGLPSGDIGKKLAEAERMVREMEQRDFNTQKLRAERERDEAQKLLNRVKNNLVKQLEENQRKSEKVSDMLKQYDTKLNDLRDALKEASGVVDKANQLNRGNLLALSDVKARMQELKQEQEKVEDQVKMAKVQLDQTNDLLRKLDESRVEYERLAAQLDGAKSELGDKVKELSQAGSKEDIVLKAEEHARNLDQQAKELQEAVKNASSNSAVRCAVDGIEAYKNITDAIKAAEDAANRAKEAADNALNTVQQEDLSSKGKKLRDDGDKLLNDAKNAEANLKAVTPELNNLNKRFEAAKKKEKTLQNDLRSAQDELSKIKRDDISDTINRAKDMADRAQDKAGDVMNKLNPIKAEVDKIKSIKGAGPVDPSLNKVLGEVDQSVKNLSSAIPTLLDRMDKVEEMSRQLTPSSNISDNVERIKELIKQARDAANKIVVPMIFNGNSHVEVQPPSNLEDLKAYTSLSLYLHRPVTRGDRRRRQADSGNMFVMYLGKKDASTDYIGMALRDNALFCVYNLRGKEIEIQMDTPVARSLQDQSILDKVKFERIYQNAKLLYTKSSTSTSPENQPPITKDGEYTDNLLNLDPNDVVFYVGGFPNEFKPPRSLNLSKYKGCIELDALNDEVISLYNFKKVYNVNVESPCKRYKEGSDQYFFEGTGFARIALKDKYIGQYEFTIQTNSDNALLFYIENEKSHFIVTLEQGKVVWRGKVENMEEKEARTSEKIFKGNDAVRMVIYLRDKQFIISMGSNPIKEVIDIEGSFSEYYIGGVTTSTRKSKNINIPPLRGCVKNIKHPSGNAELRDTVGVSRGCSSDSLLARFASIRLGGYLDVAPNSFELTNDVVIGLGFRTTQPSAPLLQNSQAGNKLDLRLNENGFVIFNLDGQILKTDKNYGDGKWHYLVATKNSEGTKLIVDETEEGKVGQRSTSNVQNNRPNIYLGKDTFDGCITDVYLKRSTAPYDVEDLRTYSKTENVSLGVCNTEEPPQSIMLKKNWSRSNLNRDKPVKVCRMPKTTSGAYHLSLLSGLVYDFNPESLQEGSHFSVDIRTSSEEGLIFFIGSERGASHLALYISNGRIVFSLSSSEKKRRISIKEKYNDGQWHTVMFGRVGSSCRLVIDGLKAQNASFPQGSSIDLRSPIYLGSLPALYSGTSGLKNIPNHSIVGCVRNLKVNSQKMSAPTGNRRVAPCFVGRTESGIYFSGNHGYIDFANTNDVGMDFQFVFEIRPRSLTGVLFHFRGQSGDHLSLFLNNGQVTAMVKNGMGNFSTSVTPQQSLCDGMFHRIAVNRGKNVIQVDVDTKHNYTVGTLHSQSTDTEQLYIGGIPDTVPSPLLPVSTSFVGCLQNVQINGNPVSFNPAEVHGPVILSGCPLA